MYHNSANKYVMNVLSHSPMYLKILYFVCDKYEEQFGLEKLNNIFFSEIEKINTDREIKYQIPVNVDVCIKYDEEDIIFRTEEISEKITVDLEITSLYNLKITACNKKSIDKLIFEVDCTKKIELKIYHYDLKCWRSKEYIHDRTEETIIMNEKIKKKLFTDINNFIKNEQSYKKHGIQYKRNYLFHGPPGTGKTSLINIIANKIKRNVYVLSFDVQMTDNILFKAINEIKKENAILLLEDIDCFLKNDNKTNTNISLSALLNVLDGIGNKDGLITFLTTNHVNLLDAALLRPGRIDAIYEFNIISSEQIKGLLKAYNIILDDDIFENVLKLCQRNNLVVATLSEFMFRNIRNNNDNPNDDKDEMKFVDELNINDNENFIDHGLPSIDQIKLPVIEENILDNNNFIDLFKKYLLEINIVISKNKQYDMYS